MNRTLIAILLVPILGPVLWWLLNLPGKWASKMVWKYLPYGKIRSFLLRNGDPFKAAEPPIDPSSRGYQKARRPTQPLEKPKR